MAKAAIGRLTGGLVGVPRNGRGRIRRRHLGQQTLSEGRRDAGLDPCAAVTRTKVRGLLRSAVAALVRGGLRTTPGLAQDAGVWASGHSQDGEEDEGSKHTEVPSTHGSKNAASQRAKSGRANRGRLERFAPTFMIAREVFLPHG